MRTKSLALAAAALGMVALRPSSWPHLTRTSGPVYNSCVDAHTSTAAVGAADYNHYTGVAAASATAYNHYTGSAAREGAYHNPYTGTTAAGAAHHDPSTGTTAARGESYNS